MGLFDRKKVSSTSTTQNFQENNTLASEQSGIVTDGAVISGSNNVVNQDFTPEIASGFSDLIGLVGDAIDFTRDTSKNSLDAVITANQQIHSPENATYAETIKKLVPLAMLGIISITIITVFKK